MSPAPAKPGDRWGSMSRALSSWWLAAVALFGITLVFYHRLWLPGLVLIQRDAFQFHLPIKQYMVERLSAGELPQWFPYEALGRPFLGTTATGIFHPFTALYFLLTASDAYRASTLLSCLLAAFGAFALGRRLAFSPAGALAAGAGFALSGYVVSVTDNIQYLYSICVLPLFCAALDKALAEGRAWPAVPAVVWATVFLNGDVQTGYYFGFIALLWTAARVSGLHDAMWLRLALAGGLTALLAGIQLGPAAAVFAGSHRLQADLFHEEAFYWSTHPLRLLTVLASPVGENANPVEVGRLFFGTPQRGAMGGTWAESLYLGIPVSGLVLLGAWQRRDLRVLVVLGGAALLLALGRFGGLYEVFYHVVPLWSAFRYPEKLMGVVSFAAAMLAGAGLDALRARQGNPTLWLVAALLCGGLWLALRTEAAASWAAATFDAPAAMAGEMTRSAARAFIFSAGAALAVWGVVRGNREGWLDGTLFPVTLVTILALDLGRGNLHAYRTGPVEAATFIPPLVQAIADREGALGPGRFRLISIRESKYMVRRSLQRLLGRDAESVERRQALDVEHNARFHLETTHAYLPGYNRALAVMLPDKPEVTVAARFNVAYFISPRSRLQDPRYAQKLVVGLTDFDLGLFQNPAPVKPRAYLSLKPERAASPPDPSALVARPDFQSGEVDVIETSAATLPGPAKGGRVVMERYAPEEVRIRVETPQPAVLVLLDSFAPGWHATLENGIEAPIMRANALARAVVVPAGDHVVTFSYRTPLLQAGAGASLIGGLICLAMIVQAVQRTGQSRCAP